MATQVIQKPVGSLEKTLESLTNHALNQMHRRREIEQNYEVLRAQNYPEHVAKALAPASEKERLNFMKMYEPNPEFQQPNQQQQQPNAGGFNPNIPEDQLKGFIDYLNSPEPEQPLTKEQQIAGIPNKPGLENLLGLKNPQQIPTQAPKTMQAGPMIPPQQQAAPVAQPSAPQVQPQANIPALKRRATSAANGGITEYQREKLAQQDEAKLQPFLQKEAERAEQAQEWKSVVERMTEIAKKNKQRWPTISGYGPDEIQRDPEIREYAALANQLITIKSNALRGTPTNLRTKLLASGKINLSQPYQTQINLLDREDKNADKILEIPQNIEKIRAENGGRYPRDLALKLYGKQYLENTGQAKENAIPADLPNPAAYVGKPGIRDKETGRMFYTPDGIEWKIKKEGE